MFDEKGSEAREEPEMARSPSSHAKIGQLVVERDFCQKAFRSLSQDRRKTMIRSRSLTALGRTPVRAGVDQPLVVLP